MRCLVTCRFKKIEVANLSESYAGNLHVQNSFHKAIHRILLLISCVLFSLNTIAQSESIVHNGITRTYMVHLPSGFSSFDTLPVVFSLHGLVMNAQSQSDLSEFDPIADRERFIAVYPDGISNSWNTFGSPYHSGVDDVGFISALIDTLYRDYHIDLKRVYSCGMSNGGFMSYRLACELSNRIAAIASVTGSMIDSMIYYCTPSRSFPILHFHGTSDPIVNYNGSGNIISVSADMDYWVQSNNCPTLAVETQLSDINSTDQTNATKFYWGPCDGNVEVIHYRINGGGHTWPGNTQNFLGVGGNINLDVMASEVIWEFFSRYSLPEISTDSHQPYLENSNISIYPNPFEGVLSISVTNSKLRRIQLTDIFGKEVMAKELNMLENFSLELEDLSSGMYLMLCETTKESRVFKILHR